MILRLLLCLCPPVALSAIGQNPPALSSAPVRVSTEVVNVRAIVRDRSGRLVRNLTQDDFEITEDNVPQQAGYFSREADAPLRLGILIDTSLSQKRVLPVEKREAQSFIGEVMRAGDQAFALHFDRKVQLVQELTGDRERISRAIEGIAGWARSTHLYDAVGAASDLMKPVGGRKVLVLFTDGYDAGSHASLTSALHQAEESDVIIYSIAVADSVSYILPFYALRADRTLRKLSDDTGGRVIRINRRHDMASALREVAEELRAHYLLGYSPSNKRRDSSFRRIRVRPRNGNYRVQTRRGYYAPSE
jgi:VWFA-related protein